MLSQKIELIKTKIRTPLAKDLFFVYGSNVIKLGLGFLVNILLAKYLGAAKFGVLSLVMNFFLTISAIGDLGLSHSSVRLFAKKRLENETSAYSFLRTIFLFRGFISIVLFVFALVLIPFIKDRFFDADVEMKIVFIAAIIILVDSMFNYMLAILQAQKKFMKFSIVNAGFNISRLTMIVLFFILSLLNVYTAIISFILASLICFVYAAYKEKLFMFAGVYDEFKRSYKEVLFWGKWLLLTTLANTLFVKLDVIFLGFFKIPKEMIGNYGLAFNFAWVIAVFQSTTQILLLPRVSEIRSKFELNNYLRKSYQLVALFVFGTILTIILGYIILSIIFINQYIVSNELFIFLALSYSFSLFLTPFNLLSFTLDKPQIYFVNNLFGLIILSILAIILIPIYGVLGCAVSVLISRIFAELLTLVLVMIFMKKKFRDA